MQVWGWRIPFLLAFFTALLGFYLRMGLPEPKAFLHAARAEKQLMASQAAADGASAAETDKASTDGDASVKGSADGDLAAASSRDLAEESFEAAALQDEGALTRFHGNVHGIKVRRACSYGAGWLPHRRGLADCRPAPPCPSTLCRSSPSSACCATTPWA